MSSSESLPSSFVALLLSGGECFRFALAVGLGVNIVIGFDVNVNSVLDNDCLPQSTSACSRWSHVRLEVLLERCCNV
jgi:hypothetical protein